MDRLDETQLQRLNGIAQKENEGRQENMEHVQTFDSQQSRLHHDDAVYLLRIARAAVEMRNGVAGERSEGDPLISPFDATIKGDQ